MQKFTSSFSLVFALFVEFAVLSVSVHACFPITQLFKTVFLCMLHFAIVPKFAKSNIPKWAKLFLHHFDILVGHFLKYEFLS